MQITDIKGEKITVTDLHAAIRQAAFFKQYRQEDPRRGKQDVELKIFWSHRHSKLLKLRLAADSGK